MSYYLYNALLLLLLPPVWLYTLWRRYRQGRSAASLRGQWGCVPQEVTNKLAQRGSNAPCVWIHAVSVGETMVARPVARALRAALPQCRIALSVTTDTGFETAQAAERAGEVDAVFYYPLDFAWTVRRALRAVQPDVFLTLETELWPNFLHLARRRGARTFLVNGRVSDNLLKTAPRLGLVWRWMMNNFDAILMRSHFDAERILQLHAPASRVIVSGDVKLDNLAAPEMSAGERQEWRAKLGIDETALVWVAGSTHPGEETLVLSAYASLRQEFPSLRLILAPRHIERAAEVAEIVQASGCAVQRRTATQNSKLETRNSKLEIILLDTVGELAAVYAAADVAFVGGSLIERGGHNLLEPVLRGVPVVFGPHVANFREAAALAQAAQVGQMVANEEEFVTALRHWLASPSERGAVPERARLALSEHQGATARVAHIVAESLRRATTHPAAVA
ncbi:MAG TPA: glycosyltransferase N-terminal domain-containing protein [Abditibacteriaceae bacterium]|nr:glycosyltransferase N-terminal domain-containing protein [Abditibacteriaceae bacterium]